nr:ribonuclease H-like domain-containing protein [Tanacetum cinerariifolium]
MADFHHLDDAREIWLAVKARFGGNEESKKIRKTMLKALSPSWSQVALTLKTRGGLEYLSSDYLYNKLMSLEIDVKGGSSYALWKMFFIPLLLRISQHNNLAYEDFEQVDKLEMEELDIKWQMAMLSLRINKFQNKAGRKINFNNKDSARFNRRKARCYNYFAVHAGNAADGVNPAAAEFAMMGISPK